MKHKELAIGLSEELYVDVGVLSSVIDEYFYEEDRSGATQGKTEGVDTYLAHWSTFRHEGLDYRTTISARRE